MKLYYDLHIHSCLSPCADDDMTPCNIAGMARIKGLDMFAVTDHNSARNLRACERAAEDMGLLFLPGMELCTAEEVHVLAYFPSVEAAEKMGDMCLKWLPDKKNRPDFFGRQIVMDENDGETGEEDALLIGALSLGLDALTEKVRALGGVPVPAHVFRGNGLIQMLGFVPEDAGFRTLEAREGDQELPGCLMLRSSDAHRLGDISERGAFLLSARDRDCVLTILKNGIG